MLHGHNCVSMLPRTLRVQNTNSIVHSIHTFLFLFVKGLGILNELVLNPAYLGAVRTDAPSHLEYFGLPTLLALKVL